MSSPEGSKNQWVDLTPPRYSRPEKKPGIDRVKEKKPYKCGICNAYFEQKANLNVHVSKVHKGKDTFQQFMKERNNSNVAFVILALEKRVN